MLNSINQKD